MDTWLSVTVHPNARKELLLGLGPGRFEAWVKAKPMEGRANEAVARLLSRALEIPAARLRLAKGAAGRRKLFKVMG